MVFNHAANTKAKRDCVQLLQRRQHGQTTRRKLRNIFVLYASGDVAMEAPPHELPLANLIALRADDLSFPAWITGEAVVLVVTRRLPAPVCGSALHHLGELEALPALSLAKGTLCSVCCRRMFLPKWRRRC